MSARAIHAVMYNPTATGGHPRYTWELMTALRRAAPPSELSLTLLTSVDLAPQFRAAPYPIAAVLPPLRHASTFPSRAAWAASRVLHYARREEAVLRWVRAQGRVDVVHYQIVPFAAAVHARRVRRAGVHPVATVHNLHPHAHPIAAARWVEELSGRLGWNQYATLFVHSAGLQNQLAAELGPRAPPVVAIPHGVWTSHGKPSAPPRGDGYLLVFGVMRRDKGVHLMLDALRHLPGRRVVVAGQFEDAAYARELRTRIASERLPVELLDREIPDAEVGDLFAGAALVVLPYTAFHAQSGVLHLAIACGVPVTVTDVGALGEQVSRDGIGTVAGAPEPLALARAVEQALEPVAWAAAAERARALAGTRSWSEAAALTLAAYERLCARRSSR
jgi:glycosyltransferase involved in cell wall biosynthesis